jgi:hypothetical protein
MPKTRMRMRRTRTRRTRAPRSRRPRTNKTKKTTHWKLFDKNPFDWKLTMHVQME